MDFLFLVYAACGVLLTYGATGTALGAKFRRDLLAEEKFHLLRKNGEFHIVAGKRRNVLKVAEVSAYESEIRRIAATAVTTWPKMLLNLREPKLLQNERDSGGFLEKAISGQRNAIGVQLMERKLDRHPLMALTYSAESDQAFELIRKIIEEFDRTGKVELSENQLKMLSPELPEQVTILYPKREVLSLDASKLDEPAPDSSGLPDGFVWNYFLDKQGTKFEKMMIGVKNLETGKVNHSEGFYTGIYVAKESRQRQTLAIKRRIIAIVNSLADPDGHKNSILKDML